MRRIAGIPDYNGVISGHFRSTPSYRIRRDMGTDDWLIIATVDGAGRFVRDGRDLPASTGNLTLIRPATPHDYGTAPGADAWELAWAHFSPRVEWHDWLGWTAMAPGIYQLTIDDLDSWRAILACFAKLNRLANGAARRRDALAMNALEELLLLCDAANIDHGSSIDSRVQAAVEFMAAHIADKIGLVDIAAAVSLSPSRLSHVFKSQTGLAPLQYLEMRRLERAKQLLERTALSIKEIAAEVGYDPFYLSQRFKQQTGLAPRDFRRRLHGDDYS